MTTPELATGTRQRHCSLADAMEFSAGNVDRAEILAHLRAGGFCRVKAEWSLAAIERHLTVRRGRFHRARIRTIALSALQVAAALFMVITGIMGNGLWSIVFGAVSAFAAYRRIDRAFDRKFSDLVLPHRVAATG